MKITLAWAQTDLWCYVQVLKKLILEAWKWNVNQWNHLHLTQSHGGFCHSSAFLPFLQMNEKIPKSCFFLFDFQNKLLSKGNKVRVPFEDINSFDTEIRIQVLAPLQLLTQVQELKSIFPGMFKGYSHTASPWNNLFPSSSWGISPTEDRLTHFSWHQELLYCSWSTEFQSREPVYKRCNKKMFLRWDGFCSHFTRQENNFQTKTHSLAIDKPSTKCTKNHYQFHAQLVGSVLRMRWGGQGVSTASVCNKLLLHQLCV